MSQADPALVERLARRAFVLATRMIDEANHRDDEQQGDPKIGGHPAACSSCIHILSALHFGVRRASDTFAHKPHSSPDDHAINFLLGLFREPGGRRWMSYEQSQAVMHRLRRFSFEGEPVFQSYHAESDPDSHNYFPTGSVGIPPVVSLYTALAWRYASDHGQEVPEGAHHWSMLGDSEFREGSLLEAMPEAAERELCEVTWIIDYNRQNLDGSRIPNDRSLHGTDADRMERLARANGWDCIQVRHGRRRLDAFSQPGGDRLRDVLERGFTDFEFQALLYKRDGAAVRARLVDKDPHLKTLLQRYDDARLLALYQDLGGHDVGELMQAFAAARSSKVPVLVVAHTIKGWGLSSFAAPSNHSSLPPREEVTRLLESEGLDPAEPYRRFDADTPEGRFLEQRGRELREGVEAQWALKDRNLQRFRERLHKGGEMPAAFGIDLRLTPLAHTQYVWGQVAGRLVRIGTWDEEVRAGQQPQRELTEQERRWEAAADNILTMAPDVGTSTNTNPAMDAKVYGPSLEENYEEALGVRDRRRPDLTPHEAAWTRHIRFEIAEANCMSAAGAFGKLGDWLGIPFLPFMTVYDFFIKRAYDQLYYNLYWGAHFMVIGTPSGVTLSPEGAQHSWKSDIQMPNLITWEPAYGVEVDWILADTVRRHFLDQDQGRTGVLLRCVTRALDQKQMVLRLRRHARFKQNAPGPLRPQGVEGLEGAAPEWELPARPDAEILESVRKDAMEGGYRLVDWSGYAGYEPGDNVVKIVVMGALVTEALGASDQLLQRGIYADVVVCTSPDLLVGTQARENGYRHLRQGLGIDGALHLVRGGDGAPRSFGASGDFVEAAAGRVPIVSVTDGEAGLLDNLGSAVGAPQEALAVRKPSKSGRPIDVYRLHHLDADSIVEAAEHLLEESALGEVTVSRDLLAQVGPAPTAAEYGLEAGAPTTH